MGSDDGVNLVGTGERSLGADREEEKKEEEELEHPEAVHHDEVEFPENPRKAPSSAVPCPEMDRILRLY